MIRIWLANDHAGLDLKLKVDRHLRDSQWGSRVELHNLGTDSTDSVHYPDFADLVLARFHSLELIESTEPNSSKLMEMGILICGSGQGMSIRANRHPFVRAALCWNEEIAKLAREHNDANVLCLGSRVLDHDLALRIVETFISTPFLGGRHGDRVKLLSRSLPPRC